MQKIEFKKLIKKRFFFFIMMLVISSSSSSQSNSSMTFEAGTILEIQADADICADDIYINGTFTGTGTMCAGDSDMLISSFTFVAEKNSVYLKWLSDNELEIYGFEVERNSNNEWKKIALIKRDGNKQKSYTFVDAELIAGTYDYRLKLIKVDGKFEYHNLMQPVTVNSPKNFFVSQNYPNPGNPKSKINFEIPADEKVTLKVYDLLGKEVAILVDEYRKADYYSVEFDGSALASGVYVYIFRAGNYYSVKKMILVK